MIKFKKLLSIIVGISFLLNHTQLNKNNKVKSFDFFFGSRGNVRRTKNNKIINVKKPWEYEEVVKIIIDDFNDFFNFFSSENLNSNSAYEHFLVCNGKYVGTNNLEYVEYISGSLANNNGVYTFGENDGFEDKISFMNTPLYKNIIKINGISRALNHATFNCIVNNLFCYSLIKRDNIYLHNFMKNDQITFGIEFSKDLLSESCKGLKKIVNIDEIFDLNIDSVSTPNGWHKFVTYMPRIFKIFSVKKETNFGELIFMSARGLKESAAYKYIEETMKLNNCSIEVLISNQNFKSIFDSEFGPIHLVKGEFESKTEEIAKNIPFFSNFFEGDLCNDLAKTCNYGKLPSDIINKIFMRNSSFFERIVRKSIKTIPLGIVGIFAFGITTAAYKAIKKSIQLLFIKSTNAVSERLLLERNDLIDNPIELCKKINEIMQEGVVGLKKEIEMLTELAAGNLAMKKTELLNKNNCQLISFIGPPGVGKSMMARKFCIAVTGKELPDWGYIPASAISSEKPAEDQIFAYDSNLVKNLIASDGKTVVFFDEIDKYYSNGLLNFFRDLLERGAITIRFPKGPKTINVKGLILIVGTNERSECWGLPPEPDSPEYTEGRTIVERSISLCQRFNRFVFSPYNVEEYKQMFEGSIKIIERDSKKMFGFPLKFEIGITEKLAMESIALNIGARSVPFLLNKLSGAATRHGFKFSPEKNLGFFEKILNIVKKSNPQEQSNKKNVLSVDFDNETHKFIFKNNSSDTNSKEVQMYNKVETSISTISDKQTEYEMNKQELLIDKMEGK